MKVKILPNCIRASYITLTLYLVSTIISFLFWLQGSDDIVSIIKLCLPLGCVSFFLLMYRSQSFIVLLPLTLILYAIIFNYFYFLDLDFLFGFKAEEIRSKVNVIYFRWLMFYLLGVGAAVLFLFSPDKLRYILYPTWGVIVLIAIMLLASGLDFREIIIENQLSRTSYRHLLSDILSLSAFGLIALSKSRALIIAITFVSLVILGGTGALIGFCFSILAFQLSMYKGTITQYLFLILLLFISIISFFYIQEIIESFGKVETYNARADIFSLGFDAIQSNLLFGDYLGYLELRSGYYIHNFLSYLRNFGVIFFGFYAFIILFISQDLKRSCFSVFRYPLFSYCLFLLLTAKSYTWGFDWFIFGFFLVFISYKNLVNQHDN